LRAHCGQELLVLLQIRRPPASIDERSLDHCIRARISLSAERPTPAHPNREKDLIRDFPVLLDQRMPVSHGCACLSVWPAGSAALPQPPHDALRRPGFESKRRSPGILRRAPAIRCNISVSAALAPRLGCEQGQPASRLRGDVLQARDRGVSTGRRCRGAAVLIGLGCPEFSHLFWNVGDEHLDRTTAEKRVMRACYPRSPSRTFGD